MARRTLLAKNLKPLVLVRQPVGNTFIFAVSVTYSQIYPRVDCIVFCGFLLNRYALPFQSCRGDYRVVARRLCATGFRQTRFLSRIGGLRRWESVGGNN